MIGMESQLEYAKYIISKMSFSRLLIAKEFCKSLSRLNVNEKIQLKFWVWERFKIKYSDMISNLYFYNNNVLKHNR